MLSPVLVGASLGFAAGFLVAAVICWRYVSKKLANISQWETPSQAVAMWLGHIVLIGVGLSILAIVASILILL